MKRKLRIIPLLALLILASCGGSEEPAPHIVGSWDLQSFAIINVPSSYSQSEGITFALNQLTFGGSAFTSYNIDIAAGGTYIRKIDFDGSAPSSNDQGTWELSTDGNDLTITSDGDTGVDWGVFKNELDQLWITTPITFGLFSDQTRTDLEAEHGAGVNDYIAGLTSEELNELLDPVVVDLLYVFERQQ